MKIFLALAFLPIMVVASIGYDIIIVTPDLAEERGFSIVVTKESPYLRVEVSFPHVIDSAWRAEYAVVSDLLLPADALFSVQVDFEIENPKPIQLTFTEEPYALDVQVDVHYVCISDDIDVCENGGHAIFHIESIREFVEQQKP